MGYKFSSLFIDTIVNGKEFNFDEVESTEELRTYYNEIQEFNKNPEDEKYKELFIMAKSKGK